MGIDLISPASPPDTWQPADFGLLAATSDGSATVAQAVVNGTIYLSGVPVRRPRLISRVHWLAGAAGVTPTAGQNLAALVNSAGQILSSVNVDALVTNTNVMQTATLAVPQQVPAGIYWVNLLFNAATPPQCQRVTVGGTVTSNLGLSAANYRFAINGTGATALPASYTMASNAVGTAWWVAVS